MLWSYTGVSDNCAETGRLYLSLRLLSSSFSIIFPFPIAINLELHSNAFKNIIASNIKIQPYQSYLVRHPAVSIQLPPPN